MTFRLLLVTFPFAVPAAAQTSYQMITHCTPVAVQRGTTAEITVEGQMNFAGAYKVLVEGKGVTAEVIPAAKGQPPKTPTRAVKIRVKADAEAPIGIREFRLATWLGISTLGQLLIVADPVVLERADNNTPEKAQRVPVPCVVSGRVEVAEDVDCFRFTAKAAQTFTFDVICARIEDKIHDLQKHADAMLVLLDPAGKELASGDDPTFADPLLTYTIPKDGAYVVQVRDARYDGDPRWVYAPPITDEPRVSQLYPMAGNPGQTVEVEAVGSAALVARKAPLRTPAEPGITAVTLGVGDRTTNPAAFVVTPLPLVTEQEPNDAPSRATRLPLPGGANGHIGRKRDLDHYVFHGTKGKAVRLEVSAPRFGTDLTSPLDAVMDVLSPTGAVLASNDDANGKDPQIVFTPPADGDYVIRLGDLNYKGGDGFVYFLEADWAKPDFTLQCDPSKGMIGPGSRTAWYVPVNRTNGFAGGRSAWK